MKAFFGNEEIKTQKLAQVRAHRVADELIKGKYWENGKGCAVGCTIHSSDHSAYEREMGIPRLLARLEDGIFERLPNERAMTWPEEFLAAVPVGADLSRVGQRFMHWLLVDEKDGVIRHAKTEQTKAAILRVASLYAREIAGSSVSIEDWGAGRRAAAADADADAAAAAAAAAADAAADADADAADADADADADAAAAAADADADADAAAADADAEIRRLRRTYGSYWWRYRYYDAYRDSPAYVAKSVRQADKLLELLSGIGIKCQKITTTIGR